MNFMFLNLTSDYSYIHSIKYFFFLLSESDLDLDPNPVRGFPVDFELFSGLFFGGVNRVLTSSAVKDSPCS